MGCGSSHEHQHQPTSAISSTQGREDAPPASRKSNMGRGEQSTTRGASQVTSPGEQGAHNDVDKEKDDGAAHAGEPRGDRGADNATTAPAQTDTAATAATPNEDDGVPSLTACQAHSMRPSTPYDPPPVAVARMTSADFKKKIEDEQRKHGLDGLETMIVEQEDEDEDSEDEDQGMSATSIQGESGS